MDPPRPNTTIRLATNLGPANQFANSPVTFIQLKGRTNHEQGEIYLQLSLKALTELAELLEDERLSENQKASYAGAYTANKRRYDETVLLRDQLLMQKKSFRKFIVNLFVRESDAKRFQKVTYQVYSSIKRTSEDLMRRLLPELNVIPASGNLGESAHNSMSVSEETPRDVVEGNLSVEDLSPNETIRGINLDVHTKEEEGQVIATLNRVGIAISGGEGEDDEDEDDAQTVRPSTSQSRPPSPSPQLHNHL